GRNVVRPRSYDRPITIRGGTDGDGEARGRGALADRRGGRLVRVSRGDPGAIGRSLPRGRAVGLGAPPAADARDPCPPRKASRGGRLAMAAWPPGFESTDGGFAERARARIRYGALYGPTRNRRQVEELTRDGAQAESQADGRSDLGQPLARIDIEPVRLLEP